MLGKKQLRAHNPFLGLALGLKGSWIFNASYRNAVVMGIDELLGPVALLNA